MNLPVVTSGFDSPKPLGELIDFVELWENIWEERRLIAIASAAAALLGLLASLFLAPEYTANSTVRIEPEITTAGELTTVDAEAEIITSWSMLQKAVNDMDRSVDVTLNRPSLLARFGYMLRHLAYRLRLDSSLVESDLQMPWVRISRFRAPESYYNRVFILRIGREGMYELIDPDGKAAITGEIRPNDDGMPDITSTSPVRISITDAEAPAGTEFVLIPRSHERFIRMVQKDLKATRKGYRGSSGLVEVTFTHQDRIFAEDFLAQLTSTYTKSALDRSSVGKIQSLKHLEIHLQTLQEKMDETGKALADFRTQESVSNLPMETEMMLQRISRIEEQISELVNHRKEMQLSHGKQHPLMLSLNDQIGMLQGQMQSEETKISRLPELERRLATLTRNLEHYNHLYQAGLKVYADLRTQVEGITGYARVVSAANASKRSFLSWSLQFTFGGMVIGMLAGSGVIFIRNLPLFLRVRRARQLQLSVTVPLIAIIPRFRQDKDSHIPACLGVLKQTRHKTFRVLEFLVSKWKFATYGAPNPIMAVTGFANEQGKTFLAVSLAMMNSKYRKTLLVNGDILRHDREYPVGGKAPESGLSDIIVGEAEIDACLHEIVSGQLWYLPPGTKAMSGTLLADSARVSAIMNELATRFECVIVDYPFLRPGDNAWELLRFAGSVFIGIRYGSPAHRIKRFIARYPRGVAPVTALILNDVPLPKPRRE